MQSRYAQRYNFPRFLATAKLMLIYGSVGNCLARLAFIILGCSFIGLTNGYMVRYTCLFYVIL